MPIKFFCNVCGDVINDFNIVEYIRAASSFKLAERRCICKEHVNFQPDTEDLILVDVYDPAIQEPPYEFIVIDSFIGKVPESKDGVKEAQYLIGETYRRGYALKSYTKCSNVYAVTVMNRNSPGSEAYQIDHLAEYMKGKKG
jgi:hypothetical protein